MRKLMFAFAAAALFASATAFAQSDTANLIQDVLGNTTNEAETRPGVIPSISPGPWANDPPDGAAAGFGIGEGASGLSSGGNTQATFANRDDRDVPNNENFGEPYEHPGLESGGPGR